MLKSAANNLQIYEGTADRLSSDAPLLHWNCLYDAVVARLVAAVAAPFESVQCMRGYDATATARAMVLECVEAFQQLHVELTLAINRCQGSERDLLTSETALATARADLLRTRDGERQARFLALHDCLTSLPNKSYFRWHVDQALANRLYYWRPIALIYMDIDRFKPVNDTHGHDVGDELLKAITSRLTESMRSEDVVSRIGEDEFACLLVKSPDRKRLTRLAFTLVNTISAPLKIGNYTIAVRASIGIAMCPAHGTTADLLLKNADEAMYRAKRWKSGYAFCDPIGV